jgi:hypothetical protein
MSRTGRLDRRNDHHFVEVTCTTDGRMHRIDEVLLAAGRVGGSGRIEALCGRGVLAASMAEPPGPPCHLCAAALVGAGAAPARGVRG